MAKATAKAQPETVVPTVEVSPRQAVTDAATAIGQKLGNDCIASVVAGLVRGVKVADLVTDKANLFGRSVERIERLQNNLVATAHALATIASLLPTITDNANEHTSDVRGVNVATADGSVNMTAWLRTFANVGTSGKAGLSSLAIDKR